MRKDLGIKAYAFPMPVFIIGTYSEDGTPDAMNAAWGSIGDDDKVFVCLDPSHKTVTNILERKAFTVSMGTEDQMVACDYVGIVSANDVPDKFAKSGFHATKSANVDAPMIEELPLCIECQLISYDERTCALFGRIINVSVDESVLVDGKVDIKKFKAICYDPVGRGYHAIGRKVGKAFSEGKKLV